MVHSSVNDSLEGGKVRERGLREVFVGRGVAGRSDRNKWQE